MIVYQTDKTSFLADAFTRDIEDVVLAQFRAKTGHSVSPGEIRSWKESLLAVAKVLTDEDIPGDCGVAVEYGIPQTSKRVDFILSGADKDRAEQLIIIELKQWGTAKATDRDGIVRTRYAHGEADANHPSYQAWSYASLLRSFNATVEESGISLHPCAYLHNYGDDGALSGPAYAHYLDLAPVFLRGEPERVKLRDFIKKHVRFGDRRDLLYRIEHSRIRPSKGLVDSLVGMLAGNQEFVLIDDQKIVYETALAEASAASGQHKRVIIVEGGPGTGKSVVAINLLVALTGRQRVAKYVTKNSAPRAVFENALAGTRRKSDISNLFSGSGAFTTTQPNVFDALVVDEAHRLNEKSGLFGNLGDNQLRELIASAKCSIFFLDEDQQVTWKDIGDRASLERYADEANAPVTRLKLASQFRCNGSDGYLAWLDHTLGIRQTANPVLESGEFDFRVFDSPEELRLEIVRRNLEANKARMVAGYCWDWVSKKSPGSADVVIPEFGFAMTWNLTKDGGLWMVAPESVNEIGCIHTCQGLEVDYIGVVVGPDLAMSDGELVTRPERRSRHDKSLHGYKALLKSDRSAAIAKADRIIRNTYRTLMTRGLKGCYVYFADRGLAAHFRARLGLANPPIPLARVAEPRGGPPDG